MVELTPESKIQFGSWSWWVIPVTPEFGRQRQEGPGVQGQSGLQGQTLSWTANTKKKDFWIPCGWAQGQVHILDLRALGTGNPRRQKHLGCQEKLRRKEADPRGGAQGSRVMADRHSAHLRGATSRPPVAQLGCLCSLPSDCPSLGSKMPKCRCSDGWVTGAEQAPWGLSSGMLEGQQCRGNRGQGKLPPAQDSDTQHSSPFKNNFFF